MPTLPSIVVQNLSSCMPNGFTVLFVRQITGKAHFVAAFATHHSGTILGDDSV